MKNILFITLLLVLFSCKDDDEVNAQATIPTTPGASFAASTNSFTETYTTLLSVLEANENITIVAEVDHTTNAQSAGLELRNTRLVLFGNPSLGTPIMQLNQQAGLDLPQKMLVYEDEAGSVLVSYNGTEYVAARHGVADAESLAQISNALSNFAVLSTNGTVLQRPATSIALNEGIITVESQNDFETTYNKLRSSIANNDNLTVIAQLNHQDNANSVGLDLLPTRIIIFGNPALGTPLMQSSQTTALDLPQKMLVWENSEGKVMISYNDPAFLKLRHTITGADSVLLQITNALKTLAEGASNL
ncbi:DUF302 domain-containing protein [Rasiella sp. SM2506]|uniref:DUF302 domain-containing protein n=1 Tax=Rasiella sp. SM2506 TaxID=3423914 RepID=UPI003D7997D6